MIDIKKVAHLGRLSLTEEETENFQKQLGEVIRFFEELNVVNTDGIAPVVTPVENEVVFRADELKAEFGPEEALQNAPEKMGNLFKVPPVVG